MKTSFHFASISSVFVSEKLECPRTDRWAWPLSSKWRLDEHHLDAAKDKTNSKEMPGQAVYKNNVVKPQVNAENKPLRWSKFI